MHDSQQRRETCKQAEEKIQVGIVPTHVQLQRVSRRRRAVKGSADPAKGLAKLAVPEALAALPGRARRFLVAIALVRDLLLRAKHLFVAAMVCLGWGVTWVNDGAGLDGRRPATADTTVTAPTSPPRTDSGQSAPGAATGGEPRSRQAIITRAWLGRPIRSGARS